MKIVFATNNQHKLEEIRHILGERFEVLSLKDIGCNEDIPETGATLEENALIKAQYVYDHYHVNCFADDTGLEVEALNGAPGVYSARYAGGEGHDSEANMARLLREMEGKDNRKARFRTIIALIEKKDVCPCGCTSIKQVHRFEGIVEGQIIRERRGGEGFGYDPLFQPDGYTQTFAELGNDVKNRISHRARATQELAKYLLTLLLLLFFNFLPSTAQVGTWRTYMAYNDIQQIEAAGDNLFVMASNDLYQYNQTDQSITTYDKINALSDTYITNIRWCQQAQRLVIAYKNSNIDLLSVNGDVVNISDLYNKSMTGDKTINNITISGRHAYLSCGFGIMKLDVSRGEVSESYILNMNVTATGVDGDVIYAQTKQNGVWSGSITDNLINPKSWTQTANYPKDIFNKDNSAYEEYLPIVQTLQPGGPKYNYFHCLRFKHDRLYTAGGGYAAMYELNQPGTVQILQDGEWTILQDDMQQTKAIDYKYEDIVTVDADPADPHHVFAAGKPGLFEFRNGSFVKAYNIDNSPLASALGDSHASKKSYVLVEGICYDAQGTLWVINCNNSKQKSIFAVDKDGQWTSHHQPELESGGRTLKALNSPYVDSRGYLWIVNTHWENPSFYCYDPATDQVINSFITISNQDGTSIANYSPNCVTEDLQGNIWVGTSAGPLMIEKDNITTKGTYVTQVKIPRNDGTNLADYLLDGVVVMTIAVDGGGRKWIGTQGDGVYLISADNITQLEHFTTDNSNIISNNIESIAINPKTGEVFIGTDVGLCSYMSNSTEASDKMDKDNVYAYPNPVKPDYTGPITITGLTLDADVKILSAAGILIAEGRSNGGMFTWDGCDRQGRRVASGVYMVATATSEGKSGTVCKIAIIR